MSRLPANYHQLHRYLVLAMRLFVLCGTKSWKQSKIASLVFSTTAIALGSSAIVQVSGQNCFRTLYGSLGQIRLGLPKGSAEGSTKVPPIFQQGFTKGSSSFVVSLVFCSRSVLGCQKVPRYHVTHTPPFRRKRPIMSLLLGYSLGLFACHWFLT